MHTELKKMVSQSLNARSELEQKLIEKAWEDETFKRELIDNPKVVVNRESGQQLPASLEIEVLQETANKAYLILPANPIQAGGEAELSEEDLERVAGGVEVCIVITSVSQCFNNSDTTGAQNLV